VRLMVVDDNLLVREGLVALLAARGHEVVGVTENPKAVPALVRALTPDVVLMDIKMPPTYTDEAALGGDLRRQILAGRFVGDAAPADPDPARLGPTHPSGRQPARAAVLRIPA
jgi:DNA-binding NarL/FixJ family response regulator